MMRNRVLFLGVFFIGLCRIVGGQVITEFAIPTAQTMPVGIVAGPDGNVWFTEVTYANGIGPVGPVPYPFSAAVARIGPTGIITEFSLLAANPPLNVFPNSITVGPDGHLWFPETGLQGGYRLGQITTTGFITQFEVSLSSSYGLRDIATGSDGNLWGTGFGPSIARITTTGASTEFTLPYMANTELQNIVSGPDGNLWFTDGGTNQIGRITTSGAVTEYMIPTLGSQPFGISSGPDGNLWFTESVGNKIGRITPAGSISEFAIPTVNSVPVDIVAGPDGNLWFTEELGNNIGRITTAGVVNEFAVPTPNAQPSAITAGPDGNIWFTEAVIPTVGLSQRQKIGRITTPRCFADAHTLCLNNGRFSVTATFQQTSEGPSTLATAVPITNDTGYFWFFDPANVEMVVKVLTGCSVNGEYWVFAGGLTNVGVEWKVTDTLTGAFKNYSNAAGMPFQPIQDSSAFPCP